MRKPEGKRGASSAKVASMGANISSAHVPTAFSSIPQQSCQKSINGENMKENQKEKCHQVIIERKESNHAIPDQKQLRMLITHKPNLVTGNSALQKDILEEKRLKTGRQKFIFILHFYLINLFLLRNHYVIFRQKEKQISTNIYLNTNSEWERFIQLFLSFIFCSPFQTRTTLWVHFKSIWEFSVNSFSP